MKKANVLFGLSVIFLVIASIIPASGRFLQDEETEIPQDVVEAIQEAEYVDNTGQLVSSNFTTIYIKQNATIKLSVTNYHNKSIEALTFHQTIPEDLGLIDAQGGANFTENTIDYTWRDPQTGQIQILGVNETTEFWYIVNGTEEGTVKIKGIVRYRLVEESEVLSAETSELEVEVRRLVPGNLQAFQVITSGSNTIELGKNVTIELVLRNFHENQTIYNVSIYQKLPQEGLELINASVGDTTQTEVDNVNITEQLINYTWSTPLGFNETIKLQYIVNGSMNGTYTISDGEIKYDILVEDETRTVEVNSLTIEVGFAPSILPRPPEGTRDLGQILLIVVLIVPVTFFALAALVTQSKRPRR